jgi:hypothetical protein
MKNELHYPRMIIGGILFTLLIIGLRYLNNDPPSLITTMLVFLAGAALGQLSANPEKSFIKTVVFHGILLFILWNLLAPITKVDTNNFMVKKAELVSIIIIAIAFLETDVMNAIRHAIHKPTRAILGPLGGFLVMTILPFILFPHLGEWIAAGFSTYWYIGFTLLALFWIWLYIRLVKKVFPAWSASIIKLLGRKEN